MNCMMCELNPNKIVFKKQRSQNPQIRGSGYLLGEYLGKCMLSAKVCFFYWMMGSQVFMTLLNKNKKARCLWMDRWEKRNSLGGGTTFTPTRTVLIRHTFQYLCLFVPRKVNKGLFLQQVVIKHVFVANRKWQKFKVG